MSAPRSSRRRRRAAAGDGGRGQPGCGCGRSEAAGQEEGGTTPMDVEQRAMAKAQEWLQIPSDGERRKAMDATRAQNFTLYAMAKEIMEQQRSEGASQGRQAVNEQGGMA